MNRSLTRSLSRSLGGSHREGKAARALSVPLLEGEKRLPLSRLKNPKIGRITLAGCWI
ncbi:hypothetical protein F2Q69_00054122 [Brassica cretica]|uniref:Uncharacterized protein n=1 Tax=Brassica cretica TaxID=69181 RepID=A0A8S9MVY8_BRACR|nr:hypothetical protein F2Q69_00054122 [Brassica cretica]